MCQPFFTGVCTALVTPFLGDTVNYPMLERLLERQLNAGVQNIVLAGTTGESATLSDGEKLEMVRRAKQFAGTSCRIIAGTGSNATSHTVSLSIAAQQAGADALLVVSPYYNKPTSAGLIAHYQAVIDAVSLPVIVYNVPGRTGIDIPVSVYQALSQNERIIGVKEASSSVSKITSICRNCPDGFTVWSGNDDQAVSAIALGARGLISVLSNLAPIEVSAMVDAALDGDFDTAAALQQHLQPMYELLFSETNPIVVKAAMACIGYDCGNCRLPLTAPGAKIQQHLETFFR